MSKSECPDGAPRKKPRLEDGSVVTRITFDSTAEEVQRYCRQNGIISEILPDPEESHPTYNPSSTSPISSLKTGPLEVASNEIRLTRKGKTWKKDLFKATTQSSDPPAKNTPAYKRRVKQKTEAALRASLATSQSQATFFSEVKANNPLWAELVSDVRRVNDLSKALVTQASIEDNAESNLAEFLRQLHPLQQARKIKLLQKENLAVGHLLENSPDSFALLLAIIRERFSFDENRWLAKGTLIAKPLAQDTVLPETSDTAGGRFELQIYLRLFSTHTTAEAMKLMEVYTCQYPADPWGQWILEEISELLAKGQKNTKFTIPYFGQTTALEGVNVRHDQDWKKQELETHSRLLNFIKVAEQTALGEWRLFHVKNFSFQANCGTVAARGNAIVRDLEFVATEAIAHLGLNSAQGGLLNHFVLSQRDEELSKRVDDFVNGRLVLQAKPPQLERHAPRYESAELKKNALENHLADYVAFHDRQAVNPSNDLELGPRISEQGLQIARDGLLLNLSSGAAFRIKKDMPLEEHQGKCAGFASEEAGPAGRTAQKLAAELPRPGSSGTSESIGSYTDLWAIHTTHIEITIVIVFLLRCIYLFDTSVLVVESSKLNNLILTGWLQKAQSKSATKEDFTKFFDDIDSTSFQVIICVVIVMILWKDCPMENFTRMVGNPYVAELPFGNVSEYVLVIPTRHFYAGNYDPLTTHADIHLQRAVILLEHLAEHLARIMQPKRTEKNMIAFRHYLLDVAFEIGITQEIQARRDFLSRLLNLTQSLRTFAAANRRDQITMLEDNIPCMRPYSRSKPTLKAATKDQDGRFDDSARVEQVLQILETYRCAARRGQPLPVDLPLPLGVTPGSRQHGQALYQIEDGKLYAQAIACGNSNGFRRANPQIAEADAIYRSAYQSISSLPRIDPNRFTLCRAQALLLFATPNGLPDNQKTQAGDCFKIFKCRSCDAHIITANRKAVHLCGERFLDWKIKRQQELSDTADSARKQLAIELQKVHSQYMSEAMSEIVNDDPFDASFIEAIKEQKQQRQYKPLKSNHPAPPRKLCHLVCDLVVEGSRYLFQLPIDMFSPDGCDTFDGVRLVDFDSQFMRLQTVSNWCKTHTPKSLAITQGMDGLIVSACDVNGNIDEDAAHWEQTQCDAFCSGVYPVLSSVGPVEEQFFFSKKQGGF